MAEALGSDDCDGCWAVITAVLDKDGFEVLPRSADWKLRHTPKQI